MSFFSAQTGKSAALRWRWILLLSLLSILPFLFVQVPPLVDVPGHIGRFAVQLAPAESILHRYFVFTWRPTLNLGADLIVQALHPLLGPVAAMWLVCAAVPALTVLGLLAVTRRLNPQGAAALPFALLFVYNDSFLWGFVNYALSAALSLCGWALWMALERRNALRALVFALFAPALFLGHGEGGALLLLWVVAWEAERIGRWWQPRGLATLAARLWPFVFVAVPVVLPASGEKGGKTVWDFPGKIDALFNMLRDQNMAFDLASLGAAFAVLLYGRLRGARLATGARLAVWASFALFLAAPYQLSGTANVDARLIAHTVMLALALQDWRAVQRRPRAWVAAAGVALLVLRFGVTTASFVGYGQRYHRELQALDHVAHGSRVLNLTLADCGVRAWRNPRITHLANLATLERDAWVNAHWAVKSVHLLESRLAPLGFATDPSQIVSPPDCVGTTGAGRERRSIAQLAPTLPLDQVDYLWLIDVRLPPGQVDPRLVPVWHAGNSALYAVRPRDAT
ncbi:hypothetical protein SAMN03159338_3047 [Sphingomonas sp. NFR04]|uniref:hypothetical protein n=1 Tax=Sphingomonas sp. NFR04 TaxID=1566283 RepID=UPI0008F3585A|nr:hypothetical protein [Sphingomonas sp. NFR04]SFK02987.1 hypothetical protein SAMN03159338_3047 [Sphingomonas sp. NFR04]